MAPNKLIPNDSKPITPLPLPLSPQTTPFPHSSFSGWTSRPWSLSRDQLRHQQWLTIPPNDALMGTMCRPTGLHWPAPSPPRAAGSGGGVRDRGGATGRGPQWSGAVAGGLVCCRPGVIRSDGIGDRPQRRNDTRERDGNGAGLRRGAVAEGRGIGLGSSEDRNGAGRNRKDRNGAGRNRKDRNGAGRNRGRNVTGTGLEGNRKRERERERQLGIPQHSERQGIAGELCGPLITDQTRPDQTVPDHLGFFLPRITRSCFTRDKH